MTRHELLEEARRRGVRGTSAMTEQRLREALEPADGGAGPDGGEPSDDRRLHVR